MQKQLILYYIQLRLKSNSVLTILFALIQELKTKKLNFFKKKGIEKIEEKKIKNI